ncbi:MAG: hypothetical protein HZC40_00810 [Chloroflexi bacterium]|nr:hypothetical protein [Chloroflexota bacterium]
MFWLPFVCLTIQLIVSLARAPWVTSALAWLATAVVTLFACGIWLAVIGGVIGIGVMLRRETRSR